jgi:prolyl-tRNA editing enzyme YbaK/EbsC (Cys-tRNA(Pro) deacylase)
MSLPSPATLSKETTENPSVRVRPHGYCVGVRESWPEPVERVAEYLRNAGAEARLEELEAGTATAEDAARAAGCPVAQIVKTIVVICDGRPVVALVPGDRRVDLDKVARAADAAEARIASGAEVNEATGFTPGAVAPFPLPKVDRVLIDQNLLAHDLVWVGAGSETHIAGMSPSVLVRLARATPMDAVQDHTYDSAREENADA